MGFFIAVSFLILSVHNQLTYITGSDDGTYEIKDFVKRVNSKATHNFTLSNGDVILCVRIQDQLSLRGINEPIQLIPSIPQHQFQHNRMPTAFTQLFSKEFGSCGKGKIPVQYTRPELVKEAGSVENFKRKKFFSKHNGFASPQTTGETHEHASMYTSGAFKGFKTTMSVWNPRVEKAEEFSLAQLWVIFRDSKGSPHNTIEAGWQVYPNLYGGNNPRLFVYWTADGYRSTGCYNLRCRGFVQVDNKYVLGGAISPAVSQPGSTQSEVEFLVLQDSSGKWWLRIDGTYVGYWLASSFTDFANGANEVACGGEVCYNKVNGVRHTSTQMGSGAFPSASYQYAAYQRRIEIVNKDSVLEQARNLMKENPEAPTCYDVGDVGYDIRSNWGTYFYFGGPGYSSMCP